MRQHNETSGFVQHRDGDDSWVGAALAVAHRGLQRSTAPEDQLSHVREATMPVDIKTTGVHHVALRVTDLGRAKRFYTETLGFPVIAELPGLVLFLAGGTAFGLRAPSEQMPAGDRFSPHRVGIDHIALACAEESELERVATALTAAGVENTGPKLDETLGKRYVAFKDPDRIAWELYMA
jgi:catechol-2,3-dioxygenase